MGIFTRLVNVVARQFRDFNLEQRALKAVSRDKPKPAPKFESTEKDLAKVLKDHPEILEETSKKHTDLDDRLRQVFVTSSHEVDQARILNPDKPLPKETTPPILYELGFKEVAEEKIPAGKCSLRQVLNFLGNHKIQPEVYTAEKIALDYKMKLEDVKNLLEYYKIFDVLLQAKDEKERQHRILLNQDVKRQDFDKLMKLLQSKPDPDAQKKQ